MISEELKRLVFADQFGVWSPALRSLPGEKAEKAAEKATEKEKEKEKAGTW